MPSAADGRGQEMHRDGRAWRVSSAMVSLLGVLLAALLVGIAASTQPARAATSSTTWGPNPLVNGTFETGEFTGWTLFTTENGNMSASVVPFGTTGGATSDSARLAVGQATYEGLYVQRGGGIFQDVQLFRGRLFVSADLASDFPYSFCNGDGGTMQLLVDGVVADTHNFGTMCGPVTKYAHFSAHVWISSAGTHEIRILAVRAGLVSGVNDYADNVVLSGAATLKGAQQLNALGRAVRGVGPGTSLIDLVTKAQWALRNGNAARTCSILGTFIQEVQAQSGQTIPPSEASRLIARATAIRTMLGC